MESVFCRDAKSTFNVLKQEVVTSCLHLKLKLDMKLVSYWVAY